MLIKCCNYYKFSFIRKPTILMIIYIILKLHKSLRMKGWVIKILSFGVVGAIGMVIDFGATALLREKAKLNEYIANAIGFMLAVINNFLLNKYWTFHDYRTLSTLQFSKYAIISVIGLSLNSVFLYLLNRFLRIPFYWAKLLATALVFLWNFIINSYITFS